jgi:dTDP-4-dehydrorhamnose reductase
MQISDSSNILVIFYLWNNFVKTIVRLAKEKKELKVVFDQTGTPTFAADLALAISEISAHKDELFYIKNAENHIYNFSNEGVCSWYDFAVEIIKFTSNTLPILP